MKILAVIVGADSTATCLDAAVLAAQCVRGSTIEALNVVVDPGQLAAASEEVDFQRLREHWEGTASERSAACHTAFVAWNAGAAQDAPPVAWRTIVGDEEAVLTQEANNADLLVVIAHERNMDGGDALHAALFASQKPVLIVPVSWTPLPGQRFSHVAVGLSDSDAARRAVEAATPWVKGATDVTAIRIGDAGDPALKLESLLDDEGVAYRLRVVPRSHENLGHQLLTEAHQAGADMLVTGAYRHNQLIEWFAGGTTRHLLACADIPLLMIH